MAERGLFIAGHCIHVLVLVAPTVLASGFSGLAGRFGMFAIGIGLAALLESVSTFATRDSQWVDARAKQAATLVGVLLFVLLWSAQIEQLLDLDARPRLLHTVGGVLMGLGITLRILAIRALKGQFISDIRCDGALTQTGVYRWLRHPSEIGLCLIAVGSPLLLGSLITAASASLLIIPISLWRMRREDQVLYS